MEDVLRRVPLLVRTPSGIKGHVVETPVQLFNIVPTMIELAGIDAAHVHFGVSQVAQILRGEISPYDLRPADRLLRQEEEQARRDNSVYKLIDVFSADTTLLPRQDLQIPLLRK